MKRWIISGLLLMIAVNIKAQSIELDRYVVASGGGYMLSPQGASFQYCVGEPIIQSLIQPMHVFTQGFEQPHLLTNRFSEISKAKTFDLVLYPNPTSYLTKVKFVLKHPSKVKVEVMDGLGRILSTFSRNYEMGNVEIPIDVKHLAIGGYYVQVYIDNEKYEKKLLIE